MYKKKVLFIAFFGTLLAVFWQELNLHYINTDFPASHGLITSADEVSYLRPPQNLLKIGEWKSNDKSEISYFMRPPGFGLYFLSLKLVFGEYVWIAMKVVQILFYFLSIMLFSKILDFFSKRDTSKLIFSSIYALLPCYSGFMYFTITESITPFFTLLTTFYWIKNYKNESKFPLGFVFSAGFLILLRPQMISFVLLFSIFYLLKQKRKLFFYSLFALLPFLVWNIRTISIAGRWMGIHPIYSENNNSLYRPSHEKMTNLFRIWEHKGDGFHTTIYYLSTDTSKVNLNLALENVPQNYQSQVKPIFIKYQKLELYRRTHYKEEDKISGCFKGEKPFLLEIEKLTENLRSNNKADYYVKTPFHSLKKLLVCSQLNLRIFQGDFRGFWWCEFLRWLNLLVLILSYLSPLCILFLKRDLIFKIIALGIISSFFYLCFVQRMNEERYLTPVLPLCLLVLSALVINTKSGGKDTSLGK